jgi:hypothetical protein
MPMLYNYAFELHKSHNLCLNNMNSDFITKSHKKGNEMILWVNIFNNLQSVFTDLATIVFVIGLPGASVGYYLSKGRSEV